MAATGRDVAAATLVSVGGSVPRRVEARLLVSSDGETVGSVSFGCVEADVAAHAEQVMKTGSPRLVSYGIDDEDAFGLGLTCGGTMEVFVEAWNDLSNELDGLPGEDFVGAMATVIDGPSVGRSWPLRFRRHAPIGRDHAGVDRGVGLGSPGSRCLGASPHCRGRFRTCLSRACDVGAAAADLRRGTHRAGTHRGGGGHRIPRRSWPIHRPSLADSDRYGRGRRIDRRMARGRGPSSRSGRSDLRRSVSPTTRKSRTTCCRCCSTSPTCYIGVLGSRRTHATRVERLVEAGITEDQVRRLHGPVGLSIGAATPEEIAVSIIAEIVAVRRDHAVARALMSPKVLEFDRRFAVR